MNAPNIYPILIVAGCAGWMLADAVILIKRNGLTPRRLVALVVLILFLSVPLLGMLGQ